MDEWEKVEDEMRQARDDIVCATLEMGNGHKLVGTISFNRGALTKDACMNIRLS